MRKPTEEEELEEFEEEEDEFEEEEIPAKEEEIIEKPKKLTPQQIKRPIPPQFIKKTVDTSKAPLKTIPEIPTQEELEETKQEVLSEELVNVIRELEFRITRIESRLFRTTQ